jgi:tetratricopeptide (TPR) repeat protein
MRTVAVAILLLLSAVVLTARQNGNDLYQQGLARETAGDLKGAIQIFERIVRDYSSNRALTAKALVQLGRWSDLLGQDQARKHYERVIREFADQKDAAGEARSRLDALAAPVAAAASPARRMAVEFRAGTFEERTKVMRDGRHRLRYNGELRGFEMVDIVTGGVRRLTSDGPTTDLTVILRSQELSTDGRKIAAAVQILKAPAEAPPFRDVVRTELRVFDVDGRGPGRILATWDDRALGGWLHP